MLTCHYKPIPGMHDSPPRFYPPSTPPISMPADLESNLLNSPPPGTAESRRRLLIVASLVAIFIIFFVVSLRIDGLRSSGVGDEDEIESEIGVVAADDARCSEIGVQALRKGGHAADAAVAAALCLGVVHPVSSGIGGGAFIVVRDAATAAAEAIDCRETAAAAATENMYDNEPSSKSRGALSMGVPGEIAGLYAAWTKYGRLSWKSLFEPSIKLARDGFVVQQLLASHIIDKKDIIMEDPGLREVFAPNGKLLEATDICYNPALSRTLETISIEGPQAFYNGIIGEKFIEDVRNAGGITTMEDMRRYKIEVNQAMEANVMGYKILGMPPPSSGTLGMALVLNILGSYKEADATKGLLGLHRLIEALKHMFAIRMNLGDPDFVNINKYVIDMLSPQFGEKLQKKIFDNTTFDAGYYLASWSQLRDHGTSHLCVVDADRNAVSMTSTVNWHFGAGVLSPSTGIVLNNEMDDFSTLEEATPDHLPPAPANFIEPRKRPLSSMTPIIVLKDNQLAGVLGGSGGMDIIPAVIQVFLNHFVTGMEPLTAIQHPRVFHKLIPNEVLYENLTTIDGEHIELSNEAREFLQQRHHRLRSVPGGAVCQLVVHNLQSPLARDGERDREGFRNGVFYGRLIAVSDPRKDGRPAGL